MRVFALVAVLGILAAAPAGSTNASIAPVGSAAPPVRAVTLGGTPLPAAATAGKITVLNFWATWCPPCREETPDMIAAYKQLHAPDVTFLGIDTTETAPIVKTFLSAKGVPYQTALGNTATATVFDISAIPTTIVLDANGIVRARWEGEATPAQLKEYIEAARAGRDAVYVPPAQVAIDAALAPAKYDFGGTATQRAAAISAMQAAIAKADKLEDAAHSTVDDEKTDNETGALRIRAGSAQLDHATTGGERIAAYKLLAQGSADQNRMADAVRFERAAIALRPNDADMVSDLTDYYYRLHDYPNAIAQAQRYIVLAPTDGDGWAELAVGYQREHDLKRSASAYARSVTMLANEAGRKKTQSAYADAANTALYAANAYVALGDVADTRAEFALANIYSSKLDPKGRYAAFIGRVKERTQEGLIAVALAGGNGKPVVSVTKWTGPDLPGSLASTLKYRLIVASASEKAVTLRAGGLRRDWVASFCADGLCSPQTVSYHAPATGVKTYEFQLVPPAPHAHPGAVTVSAAGGNTVAVPVAP